MLSDELYRHEGCLIIDKTERVLCNGCVHLCVVYSFDALILQPFTGHNKSLNVIMSERLSDGLRYKTNGLVHVE